MLLTHNGIVQNQVVFFVITEESMLYYKRGVTAFQPEGLDASAALTHLTEHTEPAGVEMGVGMEVGDERWGINQ